MFSQCLSFSYNFFHFLSCSFIFHSFSVMFFHFLSCSVIFSLFLSFSFFSVICFFFFFVFLLCFYVLLFFSFCRELNICFFGCLNFVAISLDSSNVKNQFFSPSREVLLFTCCWACRSVCPDANSLVVKASSNLSCTRIPCRHTAKIDV